MESTSQLTAQKSNNVPNDVQNVQLPQVNDQLQYPLDYTTQRILEEFLATRITQAFPVGSVFISVVSTNPATLLGYGTWTAFATGRTLVGIDSGDIDFDTVEETGGAKTHTLSISEMPTHTHDVTMYVNTGGGTGRIPAQDLTTSYGTVATSSTGGSAPHNNLQPYIVTYMWKRTA